MTDQLRALEEEFANDPGNPELLTEFIKQLWQEGNWRGVHRLYEQAVDDANHSLDFSVFAERLRTYANDLEPGPEKGKVLLLLGDLFLHRLQAHEKGMDAYQEAFKAHPHDVTPLQRAREIYHQREDWEHLLMIYRIEKQVATSEAERAAILVSVAQVHGDYVGNFTEALAVLDDLEKLEVKDPFAAQIRKFYEQESTVGEGIEEALLRAENALNDGDKAETASAFIEAAQLEYDRYGGSLKEALNLASRALEVAPDDEDALLVYEVLFEEHAALNGEPAVEEESVDATPSEAEILEDDESDDSDVAGQEDKDENEEEDSEVEEAEESREAQRGPRTVQQFYDRVEKFDGDLEAAKGALESDRANVRALKVVRRDLIDKGDMAGLVDLLEGSVNYLRKRDGEWEVRTELANTYWLELGDDEKAEYYFKRLKLFDSEHGDVFKFYEAYFESQGEWRKLHSLLRGRLEPVEDKEEYRIVAERISEIAEGELGSPEKAIEVWKTFSRRFPGDEEARRRLRHLFEDHGKWNALVDLLKDEVREIDEEEGDRSRQIALLEEMAHIYRTHLNLDAMVINIMSQILEIDPVHPSAFAELRELYVSNRRFNELATLLSDAAERAAATKDIGQAVGYLLEVSDIWEEQLNNQTQAIPFLERIVELAPEEVGVRDRLREIYEKRRDFKSLFDLRLQESTLMGGEDAHEELQELLELARERLRDPEREARVISALLKEEPEDRQLLQELERVYHRMEDWESMARTLERRAGLLDGDENADVLSKAAALRQDKLEQPEEAARLWKLVLDVRDDEHAFDSLSQILVTARDYDELETLYCKADEGEALYELFAELTAVYEDHAVVLERRRASLAENELQDPKRVIEALENLSLLVNEPSDARRELLGWYRKVDDIESEIQTRIVLLESEQDDDAAFEAISTIVDLEESREELDSALSWTLQAFSLRPDDAEILARAEDFARQTGMLEALVQNVMGEAEDQQDSEVQEAIWSVCARIRHQDLEAFEEAIEWYQTLRERHPQGLEYLEALDQLYEQTEEPAKRIHVLKDQIDALKDQGASEIDLVDQLSKIADVQRTHLGETDSARQTYSQILDLQPEHLGAIRGLKEIHREEEQWRDVVDYLLREIPLAGFDSQKAQWAAKMELADVHRYKLEDTTEALRYYGEILGENPEFEAAVEAVRELLAVDGLAREAAMLLEPILRDLRQAAPLAEALEARLRVCDDPFEEQEILDELIPLYAEDLEDVEVAFLHATRQFEIDPERDDIWLRFEQLGAKLNKWELIEEMFTEESPLQGHESPTRFDLLRHLAAIREHRLQQSERALEAWECLHNYDPLDMPTLEALERLYRKTENKVELVVALRARARLVDLDEDRIELLMEAGLLLALELDNVIDATDVFREVLNLDPEHEKAVSVLQELLRGQERWHDLDALLSEQAEQTIQPDRRRGFLKSLSVLRYEKLEDAPGSVMILCDLMEDDPGDDEVLDFAREVDLELAKDSGRIQLRLDLAKTLEPIYRMRGEYDRLDDILEVRLEAGVSDFERVEILDELVQLRQQRLGNPDGALDALSLAVIAQPDDEERRQRLLELAIGVDRLEDAAATLVEAAENTDAFVALEIWKRLGRLATQKLDEPMRAIEYFERARELDEADITILEALERLFESTQQPDRLCENLSEQARFADPDKRLNLLRRIGTLRDKVLDQPVEAIDIYRQIREIDPDDLPAIEALERIYRTREQFFDLVELMRQKVEIVEPGAPRLAVLQEWAQVAEEELNDVEQTVRIYRRILENEPEHPRALAELDRLLEAEMQWMEWTEIARRRLQGPGRADLDIRLDLELRLARVFTEELFEVAQALEVYRELLTRIEYQPDAVAALEKLAAQDEWLEEVAVDLDLIYREQSRWEDLYELVLRRRELAMDPERKAEYFYEGGVVLRDRLDRQEDALRAFADAWKLDIEQRRYRAALDELAASEGAWQLLVELLGEILTLVVDPDRSEDLHLTLARLWRDVLEEPLEAETHFRDVISLDPHHEEAFTALLDLLEGQERWHDLVELLERRHDAVIGESDKGAIELLLIIAGIQDEHLEDGFSAVETLNRVRVLDTRHSEALEELKRLLKEQERWEDLAALYEERAAAASLPSEVLEAELALAGLCRGALGQVERAVGLYGRALAIDAEHQEAIAALEEIFEEEEEFRAEAGRLLEPLYRTRQNDEALAQVLEARAGAETDPQQRLQWLRELAQIVDEVLKKPAWAWTVSAQIFSEDPADEAVRHRLKRLTARAHGWESLVEVYIHTLETNFEISDELRGHLHVERAHFLANRIGDLPRAREAAEMALQMMPDDREAVDLLECLLERQKAWLDLAEYYRNRADFAADEDRSRYWYEKLAALYEDVLSDVDATVDVYAKLLELSPGEEEYRSAMERILGSVGRWYDLADIYRQRIAGALDPEIVAANKFALAQLLETELNAVQEAIDLYQQLLEENSGFSEAIRALEGLRRDLTRREEGSWEGMRLKIIQILLETYKESRSWQRIDNLLNEQIELTENPEDRVTLFVDKAELLLRSSDDSTEKVSALMTLAEAYCLEPTNEEIAQKIDDLATDLDAWERVVPIYLRSLGETDDVDRQGHILAAIAQVYEGPIGDLESAIAAYQQSVEISVESEIALEKLQELYGEMQKWQPLVVILEKRLEVEYDIDMQRTLRKRVARIYDEVLANPREAIRLYTEIRRDEPEELANLVILQRLYEAIEDYEGLEQLLLDKLMLIDAEAMRARALKRLGEIRRDHLDRMADAVSCFQDVLSITPDDKEVLKALTEIYRAQEQWPEMLDIVRVRRELAEALDTINEFELLMGDILLEHLNDYDAAFGHYEAALQRDAHNYMARGALFRVLARPTLRRRAAEVLTEIHRQEKEWDDLEALYERLLELSEDNPQFRAEQYIAMAQMQIDAFDLEMKAFATLGRAMRDVPESQDVREELERLASVLGSSDDLVAIYEDALEVGVEDLKVKRALHLVVGEGYATSLEDPNAAIPHFEAVLEMDEYDADALRMLSFIYQSARDWENLTRVLDSYLAVAEGDAQLQTRFQLGYLREVVYEDFTEAFDLYRQVLLDVPGHTGSVEGLERLCEDLGLRGDILNLLEPIYRDGGDWSKLVRLFTLKLETLEDSMMKANIYRQIAEIQLEKLDDSRSAFSSWSQALRQEPQDAQVEEKLEAIAEEENLYDALVAVMEEIVAEIDDPNRKMELANKAGAWALNILGDTPRAAGLYREVLAVEPEHEEALEILESIARNQGDDESLAAVLAARVQSTFDPNAQIELYTELASVRVGLTDYAGAIEAFEQLMILDGESLERLETLAHLFEITENWSERVAILERLLNHREDESQRFDTLIQIGFLSLENLEDFGGARRALEDAQSIEADSPEILRALEDVYAGLQDWTAMMELLERELELSESEGETLRLLVRRADLRYEANNDVDGAIEDYQAAFAIQDDHADIINALSGMYRSERRWEDLIELLTTQIEQSEDSVTAAEHLLEMAAICQDELRSLDRAVDFASTAFDLHPGSEAVLERLEKVQRARQDWTAVVEFLDFRISSAEGEERDELLRERARTLEEDAGSLEAAAQTYRVLLEGAPDDVELIEHLESLYEKVKDGNGLYELAQHRAQQTEDIDRRAELFLEMGEIARKYLGGGELRIDALEAARALKGDDDLDIVEPLLDSYIEGQRFDLAEPLLDSVIESLNAARKMKDVVRFYHLRGKLAEQQGDVDAARESYEEAHRIDATFVPNLLSLGKLSFQAEDWEHAKKIFQILLLHQMNIKDKEDKVEVYYHLGAIREQNGDERGARDMFKRALRVQSDHADSKAALAMLDS